MDTANPDYVDLLAAFNAQNVEFIIVGAHALAAHGIVRASGDLDVWIRPAPENASHAYRALTEFGAPLADVTEEDLCTPGVVFQIGVAPIRVDVMTFIDGVAFEDAWGDRVETFFGGQPVGVLSKERLIINKRATGRDQDRIDADRLERLHGA